MIKVRQNLRQMVTIATCLAVASMMFSSCGQSAKGTKMDLNSEAKQGEGDLSRQDEGVVINGVKWATRNVDKPGTFAANPEKAGMFYQWNSNKAFVTNELASRDETIPVSDSWTKANDPSPAHWRVPTIEEIKSLLDTKKVTNEWTTHNGVNGRKFTDKVTGNSLFLPATGLNGNSGIYWSKTANDSYNDNAYALTTTSSTDYADIYSRDLAKWSGYNCDFKFSIRSVAE